MDIRIALAASIALVSTAVAGASVVTANLDAARVAEEAQAATAQPDAPEPVMGPVQGVAPAAPAAVTRVVVPFPTDVLGAAAYEGEAFEAWEEHLEEDDEEHEDEHEEREDEHDDEHDDENEDD